MKGESAGLSPQTPQPQPEFRFVRTAEDLEALRGVRNDCRTFMTRDPRFITSVMQAAWWEKRHMRHTLVALLWLGDKAIAYALVDWDSKGRPWVSGGVRAPYRGAGYGTAVFTYLSRVAAPRPAYLSVLASNYPARALYRKLGWKTIRRRGEIITMRLT